MYVVPLSIVLSLLEEGSENIFEDFNNVELFSPRESLVSDIPAGEGNIE